MAVYDCIFAPLYAQFWTNEHSKIYITTITSKNDKIISTKYLVRQSFDSCELKAIQKFIDPINGK